jgi:hypothetical protein
LLYFSEKYYFLKRGWDLARGDFIKNLASAKGGRLTIRAGF